jgi:hypothetical protein
MVSRAEKDTRKEYETSTPASTNCVHHARRLGPGPCPVLTNSLPNGGLGVPIWSGQTGNVGATQDVVERSLDVVMECRDDATERRDVRKKRVDDVSESRDDALTRRDGVTKPAHDPKRRRGVGSMRRQDDWKDRNAHTKRRDDVTKCRGVVSSRRDDRK